MSLFIGVLIGLYCFFDASTRRMKNPLLWGIAGLLGNVFVIAFLHGHRWLKEGETRSGGRGWDTCRWLAIGTSVFFFLAGITGSIGASTQVQQAESNAAVVGTAIGATLGLGAIFFLWFLVTGGVLFFGLILKKDAKEIGPTGPLATKV